VTESAAVPSAATPPSTTRDAVTCPFCGLLCDDLTVTITANRITAGANACPKARAAFARAVPPAVPLVDGKATSYGSAVATAIKRLKKSRQPLLAGLGTDVDGMRAALLLAERCGAILDHLHGRALLNNLRVLQARGQATTTLGEVRNRADLVVLVGAAIDDDFHAFTRRCLRPSDALLPERLARRRILHLGPANRRPQQPGVDAQSLPCRDDELLETVNAVRALRAGRATRLKGRRLQLATTLVDAIAAADYAVFVWAPGQLGGDGDLVIAAVCDLIANINETRRAAGLALGGNDGAQSALATAAWHTGYPLQLSYAGATLDYDPLRFDTARLLADGAVDLLLWISTFTPVPAPATDVPSIVLGMPGMTVRPTNSVFLPVGTPGLDHAARLMRTDGVIALPLERLRDLGLPSAATLLADLADGIA